MSFKQFLTCDETIDGQHRCDHPNCSQSFHYLIQLSLLVHKMTFRRQESPPEQLRPPKTPPEPLSPLQIPQKPQINTIPTALPVGYPKTSPKRVHKCSLNECHKTFKTKNSLTVHHMTQHPDAFPHKPWLQCSHTGCQYRTKSKCYLLQHMTTHKPRPVSTYRCDWDGCQYATFRRSDLTKHRMIHSTERQFKYGINDCTHDTNNRYDLTRHQLTRHPDAFPDIPWMECSHMGYQYRTKHAERLKLHVNYNHSKPYQCRVCGKGFGAAYVLGHHEHTHNPELKIRCEWEGCDRLFAHRTSLSMHMKTHTAPDTYRCSWPGCDKSCALKHKLLNHEQTVHKPIIYRCSECGKEFNKEYDLRHHQKVVHEPTHHPELKVRCEWHECDRVFKARKYMLRHMNMHTMARTYRCPYEGYDKVYGNSVSYYAHKLSHKTCN